jgi:hypothetical protein
MAITICPGRLARLALLPLLACGGQGDGRYSERSSGFAAADVDEGDVDNRPIFPPPVAAASRQTDGAGESPAPANDPAPDDLADCPVFSAEPAVDPTCEYSFDLDACTGDWHCADGRHSTLTVLTDVDFGSYVCGFYARCDHRQGFGVGEVCGPASDEPVPCALDDEAEARNYCGPYVEVRVPAHCLPF